MLISIEGYAMSGKHRAPIAAAAAGLALLAAQARADTTVIGNGLAAECSNAARAASSNQPVLEEAIHECSLALDEEALSPHETAATFVNRGVLRLAGAAYGAALEDFDRALAIEPGLPEAMVDRGAALIGEGHFADGVSEITRGLERQPIEPEKAYFNRALAEERLGDLRAAYFDYQKALELKPGWPAPKAELARFHVVQH